MLDLGTVKPGSTIRIPFSSFDKDDGSSITMTNYAAADILVYKDGGTTERASTAGYTATTDFDTKTGKHVAVIDLADNTTADFWAAGSEYLVAIDAVTVDTVTTGGWIGRFRIGYQGAILDTTIATLTNQTSFTLTAGPAEDDALNGMWAVIHDAASAVQASWVEISDYTGASKTVTLAAGATFTVAAKDNISVMFPSPLRPTTTGSKLDVSSGGEAGLDWANVGSPTTAVNLSGTTTNVVNTATAVTTVNGLAANVITSTAIAANAITEDAFDTTAGSFYPAGIIDQGTAQSATGTTIVLRAAAAFANDEIIGATILITGGTTGVGQSRVITDYVSATDTATVDTWTTTPSGTITYKIFGSAPSTAPTAAVIADAVWDEATAGHVAAGSFGKLGADVLEDTGTTIPALFPANFSTVTIASNAVLAKLGDLAHGGTAATLTFERIIGASTTANEPAMKLTGNGSGAGILSTGGATGDGVKYVGGASGGHGAYFRASAGNNNGIYTQGSNAGDGAHFEAGATGQGVHINGDYLISGATTFTGAVGLSSTLTVTGAMTLTAGMTGNITGNLSGSVGSVTTKTGYELTSAYDFAKGTVAVTESYSTDGAAPTPVQALMGILQALTEVTISSTTMTIKKLDGSTTAMTLTLNDATTPTSKTRSG
jgi:hypothetical protein